MPSVLAKSLAFPVKATMVLLLLLATATAQSAHVHDHTAWLFVATDCPKAARAALAFQDLARGEYSRSIRFVLVFPNPKDTPEKIADWCAQRLLTLPVASSPQFLRDRFHPEVTPEVVLTDHSGRRLYRGRLSNGESTEAVQTGEMAAAIAALRTNRVPTVRFARSTGCQVIYPTIVKPTVAPTGSSVTWHKDIAPLLHRSCVPCHRSGEVGPMPLDSLETARRFARRIVETTSARTMPPWQAESAGVFHDEKTLTDRELRLLQAWERGGTPSGDSQTATPLPVQPPEPDWYLGNPDRIFTTEPYTTPAQSTDHYRCFVFPTQEAADNWIVGIEFKPGNKSAVHHVSAFLDWSGAARRMDVADPGEGYTNPTPGNGPGFPEYQVIGGWTPGHRPRRIPMGAGMPFPKGADLVVEVHYHLTGKSEQDQTTCALHLAKAPVSKRFLVGAVGTGKLLLKAGDTSAVVETSDTLNADITIHSITPHMHMLGKTMRVTAETPAGAFVKLIDIIRWDFTWQPSYRFKIPVQLPRGTRIDVKAVYDNSAHNPANPHRPPKDIAWGEGTDAEMCSVFFGYTMDREEWKPVGKR